MGLLDSLKGNLQKALGPGPVMPDPTMGIPRDFRTWLGDRVSKTGGTDA